MGGAESTINGGRPVGGLATALYTALALLAFAGNSLLCRLALRGGAIDAASFTTVRLVTGAITLLLVALMTHRKPLAPTPGRWSKAALLFLYALPFSFAYINLSAGTGALILFGAVQTTMLIAALRGGERLGPLHWLGLLLALGGLVYLVLPGVTAPSPLGSALMAVAGVSWGFYSLRGRGAQDPLEETASSFARSVPLVLVVSLVAFRQLHLSPLGILFATVSGALTSGIGYVIWYAALKGLTAARAATVQLAVPVIAAAAGVAFLHEALTLRLIVAAVLILGGVALVTLTARRPSALAAPR